jgi:hypothetical protein
MGYKQGVREDADNMELEDAKEDLAADQQLRIEDLDDDGREDNDELADNCLGCLGNCRVCIREK